MANKSRPDEETGVDWLQRPGIFCDTLARLIREAEQPPEAAEDEEDEAPAAKPSTKA